MSNHLARISLEIILVRCKS